MELNVINFIKNNKDWRKLLSEAPYFLEYNENPKYPHLILIKYNQISSDFYNPIVKECRGIILDIADETPFVACYAFNKFGNYGEGYADKIDWATARVQEKVDGSILKVWFDTRTQKWMLSTNGTIDAYECPVPFAFNNIETFGDAFNMAAPCAHVSTFANGNRLKIENTYVFELTGPYNKVVVQYPLDLYHIGTRKNLEKFNYEEIDVELDINTKKPKQFKFSSLEETIEFAKTLSSQEEGYVVVDNNWNRVKIKGETYVQLHHLRGEVVTPKRIMTLVLSNEDGEFLTYFPEFADFFNEIKNKYNEYIAQVENDLFVAATLVADIRNGTLTRKEYAQHALTCKNKSLMFDFADGKFSRHDVKTFIANKYGAEKILEWLK